MSTPTTLSPAGKPTAARWQPVLHAALGALGVVAIVGLVQAAGSEETARIVTAAASFLPFVFLLEGARIVVEALATRALYGRRSRVVPVTAFLRAELAGYAVTNTLPAGRAVSEAVKTAMLARHAGVSLGAAVGTASQALSLLGTAIVSIPCAIAAAVATGASGVTVAIVVHTFATGILGLGLQLGARNAWLARRLARYPKLFGGLHHYQAALAEHGILPVLPLAGFVASRLLQVAQMGILVGAVGGGFGIVQALLAQGVSFVGTTAGDLVPAQLGATDGAFALSASALGLSTTNAIAIALLAHAVTLAWVGIAALLPFCLRAATSGSSPKSSRCATTSATVMVRRRTAS